MDIREEDRQSQSLSQGSVANAARGTVNPANRFYRPAFLVGGVLLVARAVFLGVNLYLMFHPGSLHRYVERGFSSDSSNRTAWDPYDVEAKPPALAGSGRIYLVQMGEKKMPYSLDALAEWLRSTYSLEVQVLPALKLEQAAYDSSRKQYISQLLNDQIRRNLATLNADPNATIIGVTDADMYSIARDWESSFTERDSEHRVAVISADCFSDRSTDWLKKKPGAYAAALENALERILLRDVAILYWHLPRNNNPESVLAPMLDVTLPGHAIYQSELHPERTQWGVSLNEPCLTFTYKPAKAGAPAALEAPANDFIGECSAWDEMSHDEQEERFQVNLEFGLLTVRHSDFYQPGVVPIEFERATSGWWKSSSLAFGRSGSHNYDQYLGSWDDMRHISIVSTGRDSESLVRIPEWLPVLPLNRWVDQYGSGRMAELRWHSGPPEHFDLARYTGDVETYLPCDDKTVCYLDGLRNAHGDSLRFERDGERSLTRLSGPDGHSLAVSYGPGKRISSIVDNRGREVTYRYDDSGYLTGVSYPSGERLEYTYDDEGHMTAFRASPDAETPARLLLRNEYENGRLSRQTLADGRVFEYKYKAASSSEPASAASITRPDGRVLIFAMARGGTTMLERVKP